MGILYYEGSRWHHHTSSGAQHRGFKVILSPFTNTIVVILGPGFDIDFWIVLEIDAVGVDAVDMRSQFRILK